MSDEQTPNVDTSAESAPPEGHAPDATTDYESRYKELQAEFTRKSQALAEYEQRWGQLTDPQTQAQVLAELGLEIEDDEQPEYEDPYQADIAELRQQQAQMAEFLSQQAEAQNEVAQQAAEDQAIDQGLSQIGSELSPKQEEAVIRLAYTYRDDSGLPNIAQAWEHYSALENEVVSSYAKGKRAPRVQGGQSASKQTYDLSTPRGRREAMEASMASMDLA